MIAAPAWMYPPGHDRNAPYAASMHIPVPVRRLGYRGAYALLRVYWFVRRPRLIGVKCVLTFGEDVLLVRHTYGHKAWDFPGGAVKRGEQPEFTAQREMREELGVDVDQWRALGQIRTRMYHKHDMLHCFAAELPSQAITIDLGELAAARWFPVGRLPVELSRYVRPILLRLTVARSGPA